MGECRDCAWREPLSPPEPQLPAGGAWQFCRRLTRGGSISVRPFPSIGFQVITEADFGCNYFKPREAPAPDWQALAEQRGAALDEAALMLRNAVALCQTVPGWSLHAAAFEHYARKVEAARDAGPEAR